MTISLLLFYGISAILLLSGTMVILARQAVHAVLFLILCFFNGAVLFIFLGAELMAFLLMIVYVGAVAVLFLFVVMMLNVQKQGWGKALSRTFPMASLIGIVFFLELGALFFFGTLELPEGEVEKDFLEGLTNSEALGTLLYTKYPLLLEIAGLILLVAMIGAIVLTLRDRGPGSSRRVDTAKQLRRRREDVVELKKITTSEKLS